MARRPIIKEGNEILRMKSKPVEKIDDRTLELLNDMAETMYYADGVGLSAVQVGVLKRIFITDAGNGIKEFINPQIIGFSGKRTIVEGCLSVEEKHGKVTRPSSVTIEYTDRDGERKTETHTGYQARAIFHESDHLDGILFLDKLDKKQ